VTGLFIFAALFVATGIVAKLTGLDMDTGINQFIRTWVSWTISAVITTMITSKDPEP
jgi:hypothetical protein